MASPPSRPRYRFQLTRLGFHFLFVAIFAIIGGSLRGFNLLLVLAGLLVSVVIVQWRQGRMAIRRVRLTRRTRRGAFAGEPFDIRYEVRNSARLTPLWMLRIEDQVRRLEVDQGGRSVSTDSEDHALLDTSLGSILPQQSEMASIRCRIQRRGKYVIGPAVASTTFPFSMMKCDRMSAGSIEPLFVYPRLIKLRHDWQDLLPARRGGDGRRAAGRTDAEGEFYGLRPWQSGDQLKNVHWRTTAKLNFPAVRQFEFRARHQFQLLVDATDESLADTSDFELLLSFATTLIEELKSQTRSIRLGVVDGLEDDKIWRVSNSKSPHALFERLAETSPGNHHELDHAIEALSMPEAGELRQSDLLVLSGRPLDAGCLESNNPASRLMRDLVYTNRLAWLDICSQQVRRYLLGYRPTRSLNESTMLTASRGE